MDKETFLSICNGYEGKIEEQDDSIIFSAYNKLETWENVENEDTHKIVFVKKVKKVYCELKYRYLENKLDGYEETYEICGGFCTPSADEKEVLYYLKKYNFKEKDFIPLL